MFPIPFNFPFRKSNGDVTTIDDAISSGGGGGYTLPTASAFTKGGVKIGSGLTMDGETLNNTNPTPYSLPTASSEVLGGVKVGSGLSIDDGVLSTSGSGGGYTPDYTNNILIIGTHNDFEYYIPMEKQYVGSGIIGYEIKTLSAGGADASIEVYKIVYDAGTVIDSEKVATCHYQNSSSWYSDDNIAVTYSSAWKVAINGTYYDTSGNVLTSPLSWVFSTTVDYLLLSEDPT